MSGDQMYADGHVTSNVPVKEIAFVRPIPILGTYKTEARFSAADGWLIEVSDFGVTLSKPASQNVPEVPAFFTCGVGYSMPATVEPEPAPLEEETVRALAAATTQPGSVARSGKAGKR